MDNDSTRITYSDPGARTLTTRRGFIAATSLGVVSLYGLWAAYDAAPFRILSSGDHGSGHGALPEPMAEAVGHGDHGAARGPSPDEFRHLTEEFVARHRQPDGSVRVYTTEPPNASMPAAIHSGNGAHAGHGMSALSEPATANAAPTAPTDVYLMAEKWSFEPAVLRLRANVPYRFRMMAVDASHGASLQLGKGSQIIRLRQASLVERDLTFTRSGEYLLYCTVYCGIGHDRMSGKIIVA